MVNPAVGQLPPNAKTSSGSVTTATWEVPVSNPASAEVAFVTIWAIDYSGLQSKQITSPLFTVDITPPQIVSADSFLNFQYKGNAVTKISKVLSDANVGVNDVSATMKFVVNFGDDQNYSLGSRKRYIGTYLKAWSKWQNNLNPSASELQNLTSIFSINGDDFGLGKDIAPDCWSLSGNGSFYTYFVDGAGVITKKNNVTNAFSNSSFNDLLDATATILTVSKGINTNQKVGYVVGTIPGLGSDKSKENAAIVLNVTDHMGNIGTIRTNPVLLDVAKPTIVAVSLEPTEDQVVGVNYLKALFTAGGEIVRPTRIKTTTKMRGLVTFHDAPVLTANTKRSFKGFVNNQVNPSNLPFNFWDSFTKDDNSDQKYVDEAAGAASGETAKDITFNFNGKDHFGYNTYRTFPLSNVGSNGVDPYYNLTSNAAKVSVVIVDQMGQSETSDSLLTSPKAGFEVDSEGPRFVEAPHWNNAGLITGYSIIATPNNPSTFPKKVNDRIDPINGIRVVNAVPGNWLIFSATMVVDGSESTNPDASSGSVITEVSNIKSFNIGWSNLEKDLVGRFETNLKSQGWTWLVKSATRSIVLVTEAVKIKQDALPSYKQKINIDAYDLLDNHSDVSESNEYVSINASGPKASQISLTVNGKSEDSTDPSQLGIGDAQIDSKSSLFEVAPGTNLIVNALISTVDGKIPSDIYLDLSDIYPPQLRNSVNRVVPSKVQVTPQGRVAAEWSRIAYNISGQSGFGAYGNVIVNKKLADRLVADVGINNATVQRYGYDPLNNIGIIQDASALYYNAASQAYWLSSDDTDGNITVAPSRKFQDWNTSNLLNDKLISGLPFIQVQRSAVPNQIASVTVVVADQSSGYPEVPVASSLFASDTQSPKAYWTYKVASRALPPTIVDTGNKRNGFPKAYLLESRPNGQQDSGKYSPNRVHAGDRVDFIATITNSSISGLADDWFKNLTTGEFFSDSTLLTTNVTTDMSGFNPEYTGLKGLVGITVTPQAGKPSIITVTYEAPVSGNVGLTAAASKALVEPTITLMDDAGNVTINNSIEKKYHNPNYNYYSQGYDNNNLDGGGNVVDYGSVLYGKIAVDNYGPIVTSKVEAVLLGGTAYDSTKKLLDASTHPVLKDGSIISPGALLGVTVTVSDFVDHPQDLVTNRNYGSMSLVTENIFPAPTIVLESTKANLSGPDDVQVPFTVQIPDQASGNSTNNFRFIMGATDTIGNASFAKSINAFRFDGKPIISIVDGDKVYSSDTARTIDAGNAVVLEATAFDVGSIVAVQWFVPTSADQTTITSLAGTVGATPITEPPYLVTQTAGEYLNQFLTVNPAVLPYGQTQASSSVVAYATATDNSASEVISAKVTLNINQPALLAEDFYYEVGTEVGNVTSELESGLNIAASEDVREITVFEGEILKVNIPAKDANNNAITLSALAAGNVGAATLDTQKVTSQNINVALNGQESVTLQIEPGYLAVTGLENKSATYAVEIKAWDGISAVTDTTEVLVNILAKSAQPVIKVVALTNALKSDLQTASSVDDSTFAVLEEKTLQVVYRVTDQGGENLTFVPAANFAQINLVSSTSFEVAANGETVLTATIEYTPSIDDASIKTAFYQLLKDWDPFVLSVTVANSGATSTDNRGIDIENVSQPPVATAQYSVDGKTFVDIESGTGFIPALEGTLITFKYTATDPDGAPVNFFTGANGIFVDKPEYVLTQVSDRVSEPPKASVTVTVQVPNIVDATNAEAVLSFKVYDFASSIAESTYAIKVKAAPSLKVVSADVDGVPVDAAEVKYIVPETKKLVIVLQATDQDNADLTFSAKASDSHIEFVSAVAVEAGILTATIEYTPSLTDASIESLALTNTWDPFTFTFKVSNGVQTTSVDRAVDIENVNQTPVASAKVSVSGEAFASIESGQTIGPVVEGSVIVFQYVVTDPDGAGLVASTIGKEFIISDSKYTLELSNVDVATTAEATYTIKVHVPAFIDATNSSAALTLAAADVDGASTEASFIITAKPTEYGAVEEVVFSAGIGGKTSVQVRNFDKNNGNLFSILKTPANKDGNIEENAFSGMPTKFAPVAGGGDGRGVNVSLGDINNDGNLEEVISFSSITSATATFPNVFYVRNANTKETIVNSANDPFVDVTDSKKAAYYRKGEIKTAIGNFIGSPTEQVVTAQGFGGNQVMRLWQWNGAGWDVKAQFNTLENEVNGEVSNAKANNLNGEVNILADDFDGDGIDELVAGQGNSASSETYIQVISFAQTKGEGLASAANRIQFKAFEGTDIGKGGVNFASADINNDGTPELVVTSTAGVGGMISFFKPVLGTDGKLASFQRMGPDRSIQTGGVFNATQNPSGVINLSAGEFDGKKNNGDELIFATGSLVDADGTTPVSPAPKNLFRIVKVSSEGDAITSFVTAVKVDMVDHIANLGPAIGVQIFEADYAPTSGALNVVAGEIQSATK